MRCSFVTLPAHTLSEKSPSQANSIKIDDQNATQHGNELSLLFWGSPAASCMQQVEEVEGYAGVKGSTEKFILPPTTTYLPFSESTSSFLGCKIKPQL